MDIKVAGALVRDKHGEQLVGIGGWGSPQAFLASYNAVHKIASSRDRASEAMLTTLLKLA